MGIEGIENLTNEDAAEVESPGTEIQVEHASDQHGLPDEATTGNVEDANDIEDDSQVTENPGAAPEETQSTDDGSSTVEVDSSDAVHVDVTPGEAAPDADA